jgi:hypothetical protein
VSKAFQPTIAIYRQATAKLKEARIDILLGFALRAKAKEFVKKQLCAGKAIVNFGNINLLSRILYPSLLVSLARRIYDLLKMEPIESWAVLGEESRMSCT